MGFTAESILLVVSILLFVSCLFSGASFKYGIPAVLLFLGIGMIAGEDGFGIQFSNPKIAQFIGIVSLSFILFSGGLSTKWKIVKPVIKPSIILATFGVILTALIFGLFTYFFIPGMDFKVSMLIGSIASSTDAASVFSILRSNNTNLNPRLQNTLEFESAANDPMAYMLTITMIGIINNEITSASEIIFMLFKQISVGVIFAIVMGKTMILLLNRMKLASYGLYPVLLMALNVFTFAASEKLGGNGFLSVYFSGLMLGNSKFMYKKSLINFYEGQSNLWQIILFITLGLLVTPKQIPGIAPIGIAISVILMIFARPIAVFICSLFTSLNKISIKERIFISWAGIRGASSIVFATMPLVYITSQAIISKKEQIIIFNIVFFISIISVVVQGSTLTRLARWLKLKTVRPTNATYSFVEIDGKKSALMMRVQMCESASAVGKTIESLNFSQSMLVTTIVRNGKYVIPHGKTVITKNDELFISAETQADISLAKKILDITSEDEEI